MSFHKSRKRKLFQRLFSCCNRNSDLYVLSEHQSVVSKNSASIPRSFEIALREESLLYLPAPENGEPVLNLCFGFTEKELRSKKGIFASLRSSSRTNLLLSGFEKIAEEFYSDEPIIDGLPASLWLECIEPTLSVLTSLNSLKHRRSNLSVKRPKPSLSDSQHSRHGDYELGHMALLAVPRRLTMRLDLLLLGPRSDSSTFQIPLRASNRLLNRRRLRRMSLGISEEENASLEEMDTNHSANNSSDIIMPSASNYVQNVEVLPDGLSMSQEPQPFDVVNGESLIDIIGNSDNTETEGEWEDDVSEEERILPSSPRFSDARELVSFLFDCSFGYEALRQRTVEVVGRVSYVHRRRKNEIRPNITHIFQPCLPLEHYRNSPYLYSWNSNVRFFSRRSFHLHKMSYLRSIKAGIKHFFLLPPDCEEYEAFSDQLVKSTMNDYFTRRLLMLSAKEHFEEANFSEEELRDAYEFLEVPVELLVQPPPVILETPASATVAPPEPTITEERENDHQNSLFRNARKRLGKLFRQCYRKSQRVGINDNIST